MITVTRRYVIKTNHCELSWQPTAAVAKQGQVSFFTFFLYLIERTRRLLNNKRDERMYVSSSREVLLMFFFLDESGFCCLAHPVIEIEHQWPTDQATTTIKLVGVGPARAISKRNSVFLAILPKSSYYLALVHFPQRWPLHDLTGWFNSSTHPSFGFHGWTGPASVVDSLYHT